LTTDRTKLVATAPQIDVWTAKEIIRLAVPLPDLLYFVVRIVLSGVTGCVAVVGWRYALRSRRDGQAGMVLPTAGALLLWAAAALSSYDAIDNVIFNPDEPIPTANWFWFFLFDLPMPIWALLAIKARENSDRAYVELSRLSVTDQLTGVLNRRGFFDRGITAVAHSHRTGGSSAVIIFDIDHFKAINDSHGHGAGDEVLRSVAGTLLSKLRVGDLLGRLGGEEFGILLSDSPMDTATMTAERLRIAVHTGILHPGGPAKVVTISGGVARVSDHLKPETAFSFALKVADEALYSAKHQGRDRIMSATEPPPAEPDGDVALRSGRK
jgi:diguanylate cyclase (GGDEF)-like protein